MKFAVLFFADCFQLIAIQRMFHSTHHTFIMEITVPCVSLHLIHSLSCSLSFPYLSPSPPLSNHRISVHYATHTGRSKGLTLFKFSVYILNT